MTSATTADRARQALNVTFAIGQIAATFGPQISGAAQPLSDDHLGPLVNPVALPAPAFAIWALLFPVTIAYALYHASPSRAIDPVLRSTGWFTAAALALTTVWVSLSQLVGVGPATDAAFSAIILGCYLVALERVGLGPRMFWCVTVPVALLAGWLTIAFGVNLAAALISTGVLPGVVVASVIAVGAGIAGVGIPWLFGGGLWYAAPIIWGLCWVAAGNLQAGGSPVVVAVAGGAALLVVAARILPGIERGCPVSPITAARMAYAANILILSPVLWSLLTHSGDGTLAAFNDTVRNEDGLRLLVASLWFSILVLSIAGLVWPEPLLPVLALQVVYKSGYLAFYVIPTLGGQGWSAVPGGVAICFLVIVIVWPVVIYLNVVGPADANRGFLRAAHGPSERHGIPVS